MIPKTLIRVRSFVIPIVAAALLLTGCAAEQEESDEPEQVLETDDSAAVEESTVDAKISPAQCVIGSWKLDNEAFAGFITNASGVSIAVTGNSYQRFDDKGAYFRWRDDFTLTMGTGDPVVTHVSNSGETGDYGLELNFGDQPMDFLWIAESMTIIRDEVLSIGGMEQVIDTGGETVQLNTEGGFTGQIPRVADREQVNDIGPFRCDGDLLVFELDNGVEMPYHRTTVTYG